MNNRSSDREAFQLLRQKAEQILAEDGTGTADFDAEDFKRLVHELEVHQVELEIQNEELRKTKKELQESREEFFDLYNSAPVAYVSLDHQGFVERANQAAFQMLKGSGKFLVGGPLLPWVHKEDISLFLYLLDQLARTKEAGPVELRVLGKNSRPVYALLEGKTRIDREGIKHYRLALVDITERKQAEEALRSSHEELERRVAERTAQIREANEKLKHLSNRLLEAQEAERRNVALELHDGIGGNLLAIKMAVDQKLRQMKKGQGPSQGRTLEEIRDLIKSCVNDVRRIQQNLRPSVLDDLGLSSALSSLCREFENVHGHIHTTCNLGIEEIDVPEDLKIVVYRIAQEALANAAKHSEAKNVSVSLNREGDQMHLMVRDDGKGFDVAAVLDGETSGSGIGLASMRERCELSGGTFSIDSGEEKGTTIRCSWKG